MIQLKEFILNALSQLGVNSWDESLLIQVLICARAFFSNLPPFTKNNPHDYPEAITYTKDYLRANDVKVPFDLDEPDTQKVLQQIGSRLKHIHDFGQLYSMIINPFAAYPNLPSGTSTDDALLQANKVIKNSLALFANRKFPYPSSKSDDEPSEDLIDLARLIDTVHIAPNNPIKANDIITDIVQKSKKTGYEKSLHLFGLIYAKNIRSWSDACKAENHLDKLSGKTKDNLHSLFNKMSQEFEKINPLVLINALLHQGMKNESGLETSYLFTQIVKYGAKETRVFVDPSPDFIQKCVKEKYKCVVVLSNPDLKDIYQKHFEKELDISFCDIASLEPITQSCCLVWFATGREWAVSKDMTEADKKANEEYALQKLSILRCVPANSTVIMIVEDTMFNNHKNQLHEAWKNNHLYLYGILLLPTFKSKKSQLPKDFILLLESATQRIESHSVEILSMVWDPNDPNNARIRHEHVFVTYKDLITAARNIRSLFTEERKEQARKIPFQNRNHEQETIYIQEIRERLHCNLVTGKRARNNPCLIKVTYNPMSGVKISSKEIRPEKEDLKLYRETTSATNKPSSQEEPLAALREKVYCKIEAMLYQEPYKTEIQSDIRSSINHALSTQNKVPSLKALSFLFQDDLQEEYSGRYNRTLCQELFNVNHKALSTLVPDTSCTEAVYQKAILESYPEKIKRCPACKKINHKNASQCTSCGYDLEGEKTMTNDKLFHEFYKQMLLILRMASDNGIPINISPVRNLEAEYASRIRLSPEIQQARNALVMKAYTDDQEQKIAEHLFAAEKDTQLSVNDLARRIYCMLRYFYPCDLGEIRALTWGDYDQMKDIDLHMLTIYKTMDKANKVLFFADEGKQAKFRSLPIASLLTQLISRYMSMLKTIDPNACNPDRSLIQLENEQSELNNITWKQASTYEVLLDKASGRKDMKQEKTLPGKYGPKKTDLSRKRGMLFDSNWKYRVKEVGITEGESAYLRGVAADTTYDIHYCDYSNPFILLMMALKINRWINQILLPLERKTNTIVEGRHQQLTYYRISNPDEETNLNIKGNRYGIKATITYTEEMKGKVS